jgi:hypothetical protein
MLKVLEASVEKQRRAVGIEKDSRKRVRVLVSSALAFRGSFEPLCLESETLVLVLAHSISSDSSGCFPLGSRRISGRFAL